jgi:four helix bundle protein
MGVNKDMPFERLRVWKDALRFTLQNHQITRSFPAEEKDILVSQLKRAADSVCLNIADGTASSSRIEFRRYLEIARKSGLEVLAGAYIAKERSLLNDAEINEIKFAVNLIVVGIVNLIKYFN